VFAVKVETPPDDVKPWMSKRQNQIYGDLTREQRARISKALREGRPLADPEEAAAAVRVARDFLARQSGRRRLTRVARAIGAVAYLGTAALVLVRHDLGSVPTWPTVLATFYLVAHVYGWLTWPRRRATMLEAERLNLQVAESAGVSIEDGQVHGVPQRGNALERT
jgi:hypothetical protein